MRREVISRLFTKGYVRKRLRAVAYAILDRIRENILGARHGTGHPYPLTRFPQGSVPRVPFVGQIDDWQVHETRDAFEIKPSQFWWAVHQRGATIRAKGRPMVIQQNGEIYFAKKVILPKRNPVPGRRQVEALMRQALKE